MDKQVKGNEEIMELICWRMSETGTYFGNGCNFQKIVAIQNAIDNMILKRRAFIGQS